MKLKALVLSFFVVFSSALIAHEHETVTMPKEFDQLKKLVGTWEGTSTMDGKEMKTTVTYELTSGGTALMEKLGPGTEHEMVSMYHKAGKTLAMTHYCALGNSPMMQFKKATGNTIAFEMTKPEGVTSMKEQHMHAVTLTVDGDTLKQEWTNYKDGKKAETVVFTFKRKA